MQSPRLLDDYNRVETVPNDYDIVHLRVLSVTEGDSREESSDIGRDKVT
ncbi:hypothetical protein AYL99_12120 [Fonsecaea erecta]|uniref:Uncharacterized protein n=1 Tax=Fonsecaea erecta TaxID=1367422 RepID=A0A178Z3C1_9EURO|nr:hypothetical protein AYL99_12120 [Fonsecaea erecta]OAP53703.1 hypothetical protein AYL99_12120 [Fonsecaea erecta]